VQGQAAKYALIVAYGIAARQRFIENGKSQAANACAAYASGAERVRAAERPRAAHALAPPSRLRPRDAVFGKEDQKESGTMRIIVRALGIAMGGCLIAVFVYIMLALSGVLSDRDSIADGDATGTSTTVRPPHPTR
jgi:hypothetical protein